MTTPRSIADCATCAALPQKQNDEESTGLESPGGSPDFPEVQRLQLVLVLHHESEPYESSETRLLRCPECGTHYSYTRYEEEPHYPHNYGGRLGRTLRRLEPTSAADLLDGLVGVTSPRVPTQEAQLVKRFAERTPGQPSAPSVAVADGQSRATAAAELAALRAREAELWPALARALTSPSGPVRDYATRALLFRFAGEFERVHALLLVHPHPEVRFVAAELATRVGYRDGAVFDVLETPTAVRTAFEGWVRRRTTQGLLIDALAAAAQVDGCTARRFTYAMLGTPSSWHEVPLRGAALSALSLAAHHGADLRTAFVPLLSLEAYDPLNAVVDKSRDGAARLLALLEVVTEQGLSLPSARKGVRTLLERCRARLRIGTGRRMR